MKAVPQEVEAELAALRHSIGHNAEFVVHQLLDLKRRVTELEETTVRKPELVLAEPLDGVTFEDVPREPIATTRDRHFRMVPLRLVKEEG
jgi:hypothetical protein